MNDRIRAARKALGLSQKEFADQIGLKQNAVSHLEKDGSTITEQNIKAICLRFCVNETWLRTGSGPMFLETEKREKEFFSVLDRLSPALQDYLIQTAKLLLEAQDKMQTPSGPPAL